MRCAAVALCLALGAGSAAAVEHRVDIVGFSYSPSELTIRPGDTVRFSATSFHPLRSDNNLFGCTSDCTLSFDSPGEFGYFCANHGSPSAGMRGLIRVQSAERIFADGFEVPAP